MPPTAKPFSPTFLAMLSQRAGAGELELQSALDVSTLVKNWILSKQSSEELELKRLAQGADHGDQRIEAKEDFFRAFVPATFRSAVTVRKIM